MRTLEREHMKIYVKSPQEIAKMREAALVVRDVLDELEAACKPGVSTWELNEIADRKLRRVGATSAFLGYHGYPAVLCTSVNEVVVHGIPRKDVVLREGDIIGLDFGAFKHGFCGDAARTVAIGKVSPEAAQLMAVTEESLKRAIAECHPGARIQDLGHAVQSYAESHGCGVVRQFVGHGIGRAMHEDPPVPNFGSPGRGIRLKEGFVLAIEPMVNRGTHEVEVLEDGWTAVTKDGSLSAHFEHTVAITENGPFVLTGP